MCCSGSRVGKFQRLWLILVFGRMSLQAQLPLLGFLVGLVLHHLHGLANFYATSIPIPPNFSTKKKIINEEQVFMILIVPVTFCW